MPSSLQVRPTSATGTSRSRATLKASAHGRRFSSPALRLESLDETGDVACGHGGECSTALRRRRGRGTSSLPPRRRARDDQPPPTGGKSETSSPSWRGVAASACTPLTRTRPTTPAGETDGLAEVGHRRRRVRGHAPLGAPLAGETLEAREQARRDDLPDAVGPAAVAARLRAPVTCVHSRLPASPWRRRPSPSPSPSLRDPSIPRACDRATRRMGRRTLPGDCDRVRARRHVRLGLSPGAAPADTLGESDRAPLRLPGSAEHSTEGTWPKRA